MPRAAVSLVGLIGWTLFAFAGAYAWTVVPAVTVTAALAVTVRPRVLSPRWRLLDAALILGLAGVALQLLPLPPAVRDALSPAAHTVDAALSVGEVRDGGLLTRDPRATAWALTLATTLLTLFWTARTIVERHGLREASRGIAWLGLVLAIVVFVQRFSSPHHIYGLWAPVTHTSKPTPFGPYVNRNDLATWLILAIPVVVGYGVARTVPRVRGCRWPTALEKALDERAILLIGATLLMTAALVASLSRSGLTGIVVASLGMTWLGRRQVGTTGSIALSIGLALALLVALPFTDVAALSVRVSDTLADDISGRISIWRDSWTMARDFIVTGLGAGAFERGMLVYQRDASRLFFNHAHNEYLQLLAEGGLLVCIPAAVAVTAGFTTAFRALRQDTPAVFWFRLGAVCGLMAVAVQSVWDTGLRMPANGVLFAIVAAIAVHDTPSERIGRLDARGSRVLSFAGHAESRRTPRATGTGHAET